MNSSISRVLLVDDVEEISDCLVLREGTAVIFVVVQKGRDDVARLQIRMPQQDIHEVGRSMND